MHNQNFTSDNTEDRRVKDRRVMDFGPSYGGRERRVSVEKRQPDVVEIGFEEWEALMGQDFSSKSPKEELLADWDNFKHL